MRNKVRSVLSITAIGLFLVFAAASGGPDTATNTTVPIKDCEEMPPANVKLIIKVELDWIGTGAPVSGGFGKIFITHQKVNSQEDCTFIVESLQTIDFICDAEGKFEYNGNTWVHDNDQDLIRAEIYIPTSVFELNNAVREMRVANYDQGTFIFAYDLIPIL